MALEVATRAVESAHVSLSMDRRKKKVFSKPRSTSGCLTCKRRRVKCDEAKPSCMRCIEYDTDCAGYEPLNRRTELSKKTGVYPPPLLPRTNGRTQLLTFRPSGHFSFQSRTEAHYFLVFREEIAPELTGALGSSVWNRIVLQACHSEPFVQKAVVALAALRLSLSPTDSIESRHISTQHYEFALQEYDKAIRSMRAALVPSNSELQIRKALLGCLLVFCFESFQGNQEVAISHAKSGYQLLQNWLANTSTPFSPIGSFSSPNPAIIEEDLLQAFYRLDLQIMNVDPTRSVDHSREKSGTSVVAHMPSTFSDLTEAQAYWVLIMRSSLHFIHQTMAEAGSPYDENALIEEHGGPLAYIGDIAHKCFPIDRFPSLQADCSLHAAEIMRWKTALSTLPFLPDGQTHSGATVLKIHALCTEVTLNTLITHTDGFAWDIDIFREIIELAGLIIARTSIRTASTMQSFSIDIGVIPSLITLLNFCPDESLRVEAKRLLYSSDRREGVWGSMHLESNKT